VLIYTQDKITGANPFSGLSSGGDEVHLFDGANAEVAAAVFGASTSGVTFEWSREGINLGLSVAGQNGATTSAYGGIGSPGASVNIPEPATLALAAVTFLSLTVMKRRRSLE
jgi:hypothetical protein